MNSSPNNSNKNTLDLILSFLQVSFLQGEDSLTPSQEEQLLNLSLGETQKWQALGFTPKILAEFIPEQASFFLTYYPEFVTFWQKHLGLYQDPKEALSLAEELSLDPIQSVMQHNLWHFWLPFAWRLKRHRDQQGRLWIQGIVGLQGTGKTTLTAILTWILDKWGYRCISLSLDDLYLPYADRLKLREEQPHLIWRGPPGTHDINLGLRVFEELQRQQEKTQLLRIPRFDKSLHNGEGDRGIPELVESPADILLFEGWFVGVYPLNEFNILLPNPVTLSPFTRYCNEQLSQYIPLWKCLDNLLVLYLPNINYSKGWRKGAEQKMRNQGQAAMTDETIDRFVAYFWEALPPDLFLNPVIQTPDTGTTRTIVAEIQNDRSIGQIFSAGAMPRCKG